MKYPSYCLAGFQEKFQKLRDVYQKLRDEHIGLLRQKAETDKRLVAATATAEQSQQSAAELQVFTGFYRVFAPANVCDSNALQANGGRFHVRQYPF